MKNRKFMYWGGIISLLLNCLFAGVLIVWEHYYHCTSMFLSSIIEKDYIAEALRPDHDALEGWKACLRSAHIDADVVFFGNSITAGSDFQSYFSDKKIVTLGYPGQNLRGMRRRVEHIALCHPKKVFVMGGINDLHRQSPETTAGRMKLLLDGIHNAVPNAEIYVQSILPVCHNKESVYKDCATIKRTNELIKKFALQQDATYVDLYPLYFDGEQMDPSLSKDGVHLYPKAYDRWADAIREYIYQ